MLPRPIIVLPVVIDEDLITIPIAVILSEARNDMMEKVLVGLRKAEIKLLVL